MPPLTDLARVRTLLDRDRAWAAYAIGDLAPEHAPHCEWLAPADGSFALLLVYRGFNPPILFAAGDPVRIAELIREVDAAEISLHIRPDALAALAPAYAPSDTRPMWRMALDPVAFRSAPIDDVVPLGESDLPAIEALYDDGRRHDEGPTFFHASMLGQGTFRGIREGASLVAIAGTHLFSAELGVCTVGNVYTRHDRRRRGLAARVTSGVVQHAIAHTVPTIVLNVTRDNDAARRVYERLGFQCYCEFLEGEARRRSPG